MILLRGELRAVLENLVVGGHAGLQLQQSCLELEVRRSRFANSR